MIQIIRYADMSLSLKKQIDENIFKEFGRSEFVNNIKWAEPDLAVVYIHEDQLASFCNIVLRSVSIDERLINVAGVNNVITPHEYRGKGFSTKILQYTQETLFKSIEVEFGLLFCSIDLVKYYERLGWYSVHCPVCITQPYGKIKWPAQTMLWNEIKKMRPEFIDINGLPW